METSTAATSRETRLHVLDGLRALAIGLVFLHHWCTGNVAQVLLDRGHPIAARALGSIGSAGVELFFCLSGVVLLRRYLQERRPMQVGVYFRRRLTRLYPPFFVAWLFTGASILLIDRFPTWWTEASRLPHFSPLSLAQEAAFGIGGHGNYNWAWWSLAPEIAFYCAAPALVLGLRAHRSADAGVNRLLLAGVIVSFAASWLAPRASHMQVGLMCAHYFVCFCVGILLARRRLSAAERGASLAGGLAVIVAAAVDPRINAHVGYALVFLWLIDTCLRGTPTMSRVFGNAPMVWLGERSYSLFLTHYAVINLACLAASSLFAKGVAYVLVSRVLALAGSLVVSGTLFSLVERHFARGLVTADKWAPWSRSAGSVAALPEFQTSAAGM
jgi:peptidoglycan/LPS O-acetylase OafA/YrhL